MKNSGLYSFITYLLLSLLIIFIFSLTFKYKFKTAQQLSFRALTNQNSNANLKENYQNSIDNYNNINVNGQEGFTLKEGNTNINNQNRTLQAIESHLSGLETTLNGSTGKQNIKNILEKTKKVCDLESGRYFANMINPQNTDTIDLEGVMNDETSDNYIKYNKYSTFSKSIESILKGFD